MTKTTGLSLALAVVLAIPGSDAGAYSTNGGTWGGDDTTLSLNSTSFPSGNIFNLNAQYAMSDWNSVVGSNFLYYVNSTSCNPAVHLPTSDNCVAFVNGSDISGALGLTNWINIAGILLDADVRFNVDVSWTSGLNIGQFSYGPPYSFRGVARHEFGHALGLCHEDRSGNVVLMNSIFSAGAALPANPHWDERAGIRALYSSGGTERDLIPYMWKKTTNDVQGCDSSSTVSVPVNTLPSPVRAGNSFTMEYSLENAGNLSISSFGIGFYLSTNTTISTGDTLIGSNTGASAGPHARATFPRTLSIPTNTPPGLYYLGVCLDHLNEVTESSEGNNCVRAPGSITVTAPDMIVNTVSVSDSSLGLGQLFTVYATARNTGSASSASTTLRYYRSTNSTISTFDTQIATDFVPGLSAGGSSPENATVSINTLGTFWIGACVDSVAGESSTSNNCSTGVQVVVSAPDLVVDSESVSDASLNPGQVFTASARAHNQGHRSSSSTTLRYYRSTNSTISNFDTEIATDYVSPLSPGNWSNEAAAVSIATPGTYWIGACVDAVAGESSSGNNCSGGVQVIVAPQTICTRVPMTLTASDTGSAGFFVSQASITAGGGFTVQSIMGVEFRAAAGVALENGFSIESGASFMVVNDPSASCAPD